jgi:hypothetical protein
MTVPLTKVLIMKVPLMNREMREVEAVEAVKAAKAVIRPKEVEAREGAQEELDGVEGEAVAKEATVEEGPVEEGLFKERLFKEEETRPRKRKAPCIRIGPTRA